MAQVEQSHAVPATNGAKRVKLTGRAFYESIGSPKMVVAPMVDRSEFAWRLLTRSYLDESCKKEVLAYTPMFHARLFHEQAKFRDAHFQPVKESLTSKEKSTAPLHLDGNPEFDRPLIVQFCANKPEEFLDAAQYVAPYCDAVDLNLGCPQGIAKSGHYGAFLQEDWDTIHKLIRTLRDELDVPVTAKFRIQETKEKTLDYARMILDAGASILTVHGRQRHQKGHNTGVADWEMIRYLRENLPKGTVLLANGNILNNGDLQPCLEATGADGVMSAEGNLSDPTIFAKPPLNQESREYWRDPWNPEVGGYRIDGVLRRYMDIIHRYVLEQDPPQRPPLYLPGENGDYIHPKVVENGPVPANGTPSTQSEAATATGTKRLNDEVDTNDDDGSSKRQKTSKKQKNKSKRDKKDLNAVHNPNLKPMQGHLFQLLRPMIGRHTNIRDALARSRAGDIAAFENVLTMVEDATKEGLDEEYAELQTTMPVKHAETKQFSRLNKHEVIIDPHSSEAARERSKRPFWVCQPHVRPLPDEAFKIGSMTMSKKEKEAVAQTEPQHQRGDGIEPQQKDGKSQAAVAEAVHTELNQTGALGHARKNMLTVNSELPKEEALSCG